MKHMDIGFLSLIAGAVLSTRSDAIIATDREGIVRFWTPGECSAIRLPMRLDDRSTSSFLSGYETDIGVRDRLNAGLFQS